MIEIDLQVPSLNKNYDFYLNESVPVETIKDEMIEMISQKEQCQVTIGEGKFMLLCMETNKLLDDRLSLIDCGVKGGSQLILI